MAVSERRFKSIIDPIFYCLLIALLASQSALAQDEISAAENADNVSGSGNGAQNTLETDPPESIESTQRSVPIEQITVTGQRSFFLLRAQIEDAKRSLYSSYNEFNGNDRFDVNCRQETWTGTHITELQCWPAFFEQAVADNAQDFLRGNAVPQTVTQLQTQYTPEFEQLRANIMAVANQNPSVAESLLNLGELEAAYQRKREACMKEPAFLLIFRLC